MKPTEAQFKSNPQFRSIAGSGSPVRRPAQAPLAQTTELVSHRSSGHRSSGQGSKRATERYGSESPAVSDPDSAFDSDCDAHSEEETDAPASDTGEQPPSPSSPSPLKLRPPVPKRRKLSAATANIPPSTKLRSGPKRLSTFLQTALVPGNSHPPSESRLPAHGPAAVATTPAPRRPPRFSTTPSSHLAQLRTPRARPTPDAGSSGYRGAAPWTSSGPHPRTTPRFLPLSSAFDSSSPTVGGTGAGPGSASVASKLSFKPRLDWTGLKPDLGPNQRDEPQRSVVPETPSSREFIPGGLADTVRGWIVGVSGGGAMGLFGAAGTGWVHGREREFVAVGIEEDIQSEWQMEGGGGSAERRLLLIGPPRPGTVSGHVRASRFDPSQLRAEEDGRVVLGANRITLGKPSWEIDLGGIGGRWTVGLDWKPEGPSQGMVRRRPPSIREDI